MGIPAGDIPRLFGEFFRASNARRSRVPGTGLGLAGVRAIVEHCTGELQVDSLENKGSSFSVRLPLHECRPRIQADKDSEQRDNQVPALVGYSFDFAM